MLIIVVLLNSSTFCTLLNNTSDLINYSNNVDTLLRYLGRFYWLGRDIFPTPRCKHSGILAPSTVLDKMKKASIRRRTDPSITFRTVL